MNIDDDSTGVGQYLKYNASNKLCFYLACGIPAIVWSGSAVSKFVKESKAGVCIDSLDNLETELDKLSNTDYLRLRRCCRENMYRIRNATYFKECLQRIINGKR